MGKVKKDINVDFKIKKGFDIALAGKPDVDIVNVKPSATVALYPLEFDGLRQRLKVAEGDVVKRGSELMEDKGNVDFKLRAPAAGKVVSVVRGARRFVEKIVIEVGDIDEAEEFKKFSADEIKSLDRKVILDQLTTTGFLSLIRQRPFSNMADANAKPKSIFVNAMNTGPFQADAEAVVVDDPQAFRAGLDLLTRLTDGSVHLCMSASTTGQTLKSAQNVELHTFSGPHPAGNTSVHISRIDPMGIHDVVWFVKAVDVVLLGRLFLDGTIPATRIISLGGPLVKEDARHHYRISAGGELSGLLQESLSDAESRLLNGDVLSGTIMEEDAYLRFGQSAITVIAEDKERQFLGWTMPGFNQYSFTRLLASSYLPFLKKKWNLGTNMHGEERALVLTGNYDKVVPLNIMTDFLVRAVLAGDTDEAISLGILETAPEDFALCDFICPSKVEVQSLIRQGLKDIEEEGI